MHLAKTSEETAYDHQVAVNVCKFYHELPPKSPVKTPVLKQFFADLPHHVIVAYLGVTARSGVYRQLATDSKPLVYYLINLGIPRNRLGSKEIYAMEWFTVKCIVPSGKNKRCYYGTFTVMFIDYLNWCIDNGYSYVSPDSLQHLRKREHIWLLKGDIFIDPIVVRMKEIERLLIDMEPGTEDSVELKEELESLKEKDQFAKDRILAYQKDHADLEHDTDTIIATLDFTQLQLSMSDEFHDFVVVLATAEPFSLPEQFQDKVIQPEQPPSLRDMDNLKESYTKTTKRTRIQMVQEGISYPKPADNLRTDIEKRKKEQKLSELAQPAMKWKPKLTYLHFLLKKSDGGIGQIFQYVQYVFDFFLEENFFGGFSTLKLWSDGCGKHFKTYNTHYYFSHFQQKFGHKLTYDCLAPNRAHNRCDAAAAMVKKKLNTSAKNFELLSDVTHIAFATSELKNTYLIEVDIENLPEVIDSTPDERFMRDAFHFEYDEPATKIHQCQHKNNCNCNNAEPTEKVAMKVTDRKGVTTKRSLSSPGHCSNAMEVENNTVDAFWDNENDRARLKPKDTVRISSLSGDRNFDYETASYEDDPDDSDFCF